MNKTILNIKIDPEVKKQAQELASDAGLTVSALVNSYLRQIIATRHIDIRVPRKEPFALSEPEKMTPKLAKKIQKAHQSIKESNVSPAFDNADDFFESINS